MANARIGSHPSHGYQVVETIDTDGKDLDRSDSGKVFFCSQNSTAAVTVYLPSISTEIAGWHAKFILATASSNVFNIQGANSGGLETSSDDKIQVCFVGNGTSTGAGDQLGSDRAIFTATATQGDSIEVHCDGTDWYAIGITNIADGISASG